MPELLIPRRTFLGGLIGLIAAPAIVRRSSLELPPPKRIIRPSAPSWGIVRVNAVSDRLYYTMADGRVFSLKTPSRYIATAEEGIKAFNENSQMFWKGWTAPT